MTVYSKVVALFEKDRRRTGESFSRQLMRLTKDSDQPFWDEVAARAFDAALKARQNDPWSAGKYLDSFESKKELLAALKTRRRK